MLLFFFKKKYSPVIMLYFLAVITSCTAPRDILFSGKTTPKGQIRAGGSYNGNLSTLSFKALAKAEGDVQETVINAISKKDTVHYDSTIRSIATVMTAYSLDPVGINLGFYFRYGLFRNMDIGYRYVKGAHVFNTMYQFMGTDTLKKNSMCGSIGIQYAQQSSDIMKQLQIDKISYLFNYTLKRKDILIPLVFSKPFAVDEKYGSFAWGLVYNYSIIHYGFSPNRLYTNTFGSTTPITAFNHVAKYSSYGIFANVKGGYKWIYAILSFAMYYQKTSPIYLLNGEQMRFSGITFVPSLALQFHLDKFRKK